MKKNFLLILVCMFSMVYAQPPINITPKPVEFKLEGQGEFTINKNTDIFISDDIAGRKENKLEKISDYLNNYLAKYYDTRLKVRELSPLSSYIPVSGFIEIHLDYVERPHKDEYILQVAKERISIRSNSKEGLFYGIQSLLQLFTAQSKETNPDNGIHIPTVTITDFPRFAYRGMHLDVSRHFFSTEFVKKYIDYLAFNKFNYFHWHLTDDQGWRIEIKKYPLLTSVGGYRNGTITGRYPGNGNDSLHYGGFYTQEEIKDVVKYASDRFITIIPEIEMPGHSSAAISAYPQLSCFPDENTKVPPQCIWSGPRTGKQVQQTWGVFEDVFSPTEYTFTFLENVLDEVMPLFPSKYIHIGGDECPKENWKRSPFCQKLIKEKGLKDEHGLQSYFIQRIEKYINSKGKKIIGWDEILEGGLAPNASVMSWRGEQGGIAAAKDNHDVIMTPSANCYFDHSQTKNEDSVTIGGFLPLETVYGYEPIPAQLNAQQATHVLGAQANLWTEYIGNPAKVEYMIFPRMSALSEVLWSPKESRNWKDFENRLPAIFKRYEQWGANYSSGYYGLQASVSPAPGFNGLLWKLASKKKDANIIYVKGRSTNATYPYTEPVTITNPGEYGAAVTKKDHTILGNWIWQKFAFNKATGKKITLLTEPAINYPGSGAFTLVNGVITEKKLSQSSEWLGFLGKDLEAVIDFGKPESFNNLQLDVLSQEGSWIYLPASVEFLISQDGTTFTSVGKVGPDSTGKYPDERHITLKVNKISSRYLKVIAKNYGIIPSGKPGGGTAAWLMADEIEVN